jgi:hypothetical protein
VSTNEQTVSNENGTGTSQPNTPRAQKKKGKQKWVALPLDSQETNDDNEANPVSNDNAQNDGNQSLSAKTSATAASSKATRGARSSRVARGASRTRTRSLDGAAPKRTRKNRPAATAAPAYQQNYDAYQDYYAYYCT